MHAARGVPCLFKVLILNSIFSWKQCNAKATLCLISVSAKGLRKNWLMSKRPLFFLFSNSYISGTFYLDLAYWICAFLTPKKIQTNMWDFEHKTIFTMKVLGSHCERLICQWERQRERVVELKIWPLHHWCEELCSCLPQVSRSFSFVNPSQRKQGSFWQIQFCFQPGPFSER